MQLRQRRRVRERRVEELERARMCADVRMVLREEVQRPEVRRRGLVLGGGLWRFLRSKLGMVPLGDRRNYGELVGVAVEGLDVGEEGGDVALQTGGDVGLREILELVA